MIHTYIDILRSFGARRSLLALAGASAMCGATAGAQSLDYSVSSIDIIQTIPNVTLVADKPAFVRAHIVFTGSQPDGAPVDGIMRVFVDGIEESYSPVFSDNGPFAPRANINLGLENSTLNFIFQPPETGDLSVRVEINPPGAGRVFETDYSNNTTTSESRAIMGTRSPRVVYVPIDYRPNGGGPSLPLNDLIEPGAGDNFIQAIYPTSDWSYHRSDAPSKLWTSNLSGTGSGLLSSLLVDLNMTVPQPDFIYGWVPGSLPYNGQANGIPGRAGMGNTQTIRHQRTFAHELGHLLGRGHINNITNVDGVDVERHLNISQSLPRMKPGSLFDIMVAGLLTDQAWVYDVNYEYYITQPAFTKSSAELVSSPQEHMLVAGIWDRKLGSLQITDSLAFRGAIPTEIVPLADADLIVRVKPEGQLPEAFGVRVNPTTDNCAGDSNADSESGADASAPFVVVLPAYIVPSTIERLEILEGQSKQALAELRRSASAPKLQVSTPRLSAPTSDLMDLRWSAQDADGDELRHFLRYSPDGVRMVNLGTGMDVNSFQVNMAQLPEVQEGKAFFELLTSDGLRTTSVLVPAQPGSSQARNGFVNPPTTEILTPDAGMSYLKAATVILHCSGWDIEDFDLSGAALAWTSDVDGNLGNGRLLSVSSLSVGTHVLTVTATDSSGLMTSDSSTITIVDRDLPLSATSGSRNGGSNPQSYSADAPVIGSTWNATVDLSSSGHGFAQVILFDASSNIVLGNGQVLLVAGNRLASLPLTAGPSANFSASIPTDLTLLGMTFYTQAVHLGGVIPFALSNAQDLTIGF